jgi:regulator of sigma E protease
MDKEAMKAPAQDWEFRSKKPWQRLIVMLGGIIVNVIVGIIIFVGITYFIGDQYIPMKYINDHGGVQALELAEELGIKTGDKIIRVNGEEVVNFDDITRPNVLLAENSNYTVLRDGQEVEIDIPTNFIEKFNSRDAISRFVLPRLSPVVYDVRKGSVAERVGLQKGDRLVELNGKSIGYFDEVVTTLDGYRADSIQFAVQRGTNLVSHTAYFKGDSAIGFYIDRVLVPKSELVTTTYSLGQSLVLGPVRAFDVIAVQLKAFKKIFSGDISFRKSLSGPVGMAQAYGGTWDWERFWRMTGLLSMVLAFMNLLPIPGLDGGYVMFLLYEMISGREPNEKVFETALKIGMAILLVLMVFVFYNDIAKAITGN